MYFTIIEAIELSFAHVNNRYLLGLSLLKNKWNPNGPKGNTQLKIFPSPHMMRKDSRQCETKFHVQNPCLPFLESFGCE